MITRVRSSILAGNLFIFLANRFEKSSDVMKVALSIL